MTGRIDLYACCSRLNNIRLPNARDGAMEPFQDDPDGAKSFPIDVAWSIQQDGWLI